VGDRSLLTELLILLLAATFTWPCSGYGSPGKPSELASVQSKSQVAHAGVGTQAGEFKPAPERHHSVRRGVLDDDPAILDDNSEDWIEGPAGFALAFTAELAHGSFPMTIPCARLIAGLAATHAAPIDFSCCYRC
jgi:hypothetical protein